MDALPILVRGVDDDALRARLFSRSQLDEPGVADTVRNIISDVRLRGDAALADYTERFDGVRLRPDEFLVKDDEIDAAYKALPKDMLRIMREAISRITAFHKKNLRCGFIDFDGSASLGTMIRPVMRAGLYAPGGTAAFPSSVLMTVVPAVIAGVKERVVVTPPDREGRASPAAVAAAMLSGATSVFKAGGAQAIAALAFGTDTIPRVDVIAGPGNIYVANAKRELYGHVGIDMVAGPSEVVIIADKSARANYVAADLLSQAEHDPFALSVLITDDMPLAREVSVKVCSMARALPRREIAEKSLEAYGTIIVVDDLMEAARICDELAPEHLELSVDDPYALLGHINNAGAVFLGHYTPEPVGDYFAGPNHVLPTSGTSRFFSPLGVECFQKRINIVRYGREDLSMQYRDIAAFARAEGFEAHARSVEQRFGRDDL